jgi:hypothetical protein
LALLELAPLCAPPDVQRHTRAKNLSENNVRAVKIMSNKDARANDA